MRAANKRETQAAIDERGRRNNAAKRARRLAEMQADAMPAVEPSRGPKIVREVDAELVPPSPKGGIVEVLRARYLLRLIVGRELASMYAASLLGLAWSYVQPAMRFAIYYLVMGFILKLHDGFPYFALHLFTGIVFVHYFSETWSGGTRSIWQNRALVKKMRMPREIFPVASMVVAGYHTLPQILVLVVCCVFAGWHLSWVAVGAGILGLLILVTFSASLALFFAALNVFYKDFQNIVQTFMNFVHFMVPMMYPFSLVYHAHATNPILYQLYVANPIAQAVLLMQRLFWYPLIEDPSELGTEFPPDMYVRGVITLAICVVLLHYAQKFFARCEGKFPERL